MNEITNWYLYVSIEIKVLQVVSILVLLRYVYKSSKVLKYGLKEEYKQHGILPVLGIVYLILSGYFIFTFIRFFNKIYTANSRALLDSSQYYLENFNLIDRIFDCSIILLLFGFTVNFSKAIYTMNSLEYGVLISPVFGKNIYKQNKKREVIIDVVIRLLIAVFFVLLENRLSNSDHLFEGNDLSSFVWTGIFSLALYLCALIWFFHNTRLDRKTNKILNGYWTVLTGVQFLSGLGISIFIILIGYSHNKPDYTTLGLLYSGAIGLFSLILLFSIFLNERRPKRFYG